MAALNTVRIVGGEWRRRVLRFPDSEGLRPTPDRVRETLFNWLGQDLDGLTCLDLFAGSGALGFEAASRGADRVTLVEREPRVAAQLQDNAQLLQAAPRVEIVKGDGLQYLAATKKQFDVIFLDPPFKKGWLERIIPLLPRVLKDGAALYIEAENKIEALPPPLADWHVVRSGKAGEVHYHLLRQA